MGLKGLAAQGYLPATTLFIAASLSRGDEKAGAHACHRQWHKNGSALSTIVAAQSMRQRSIAAKTITPNGSLNQHHSHPNCSGG